MIISHCTVQNNFDVPEKSLQEKTYRKKSPVHTFLEKISRTLTYQKNSSRKNVWEKSPQYLRSGKFSNLGLHRFNVHKSII
jgi:hypothetical protein